MSIEDKLDALTKAVEANTAAVTKHTAALEKFTGKAASGGNSSSSKTEDKPKATKADDKPKGPTRDTIKSEFGDYLAIDDKDERKRRIKQVQSINEYFGVAKASELAEENFEEALAYLQTYKDGGTPEFAGADNEGEDEGSLV